MRVVLLSVGRPRGQLAEVIAEYEGRTGHYFRFEAVEVKESPRRGQPVDRVLDEEGERLLARVPDGAELVALHRLGDQWSSDRLAKYLSDAALRSASAICFVIGGAYGLSGSVLARATVKLSLSAMTFPHEVARLMVAEQLYRAGTIQRGEPYHKGSSA